MQLPTETHGLFTNKLILLLFFIIAMSSTGKSQNTIIEPVTFFKGVQVTGITASECGRIFTCFPRWRNGVPFSVVEVMSDGTYKPFPDTYTNSWENGDKIDPSKFVSVQSVVAYGNTLYILDTKNPMQKGTIATPTVYIYELYTNKLVTSYELKNSTSANSYVNDLRVDPKREKIYITDSKVPGIIVLDMVNGANYRILNNHRFTSAEIDHISIEGKRHEGKVHADGIELDTKNDILYFHALTGHTLYGIPVQQLIDKHIVENKVFKMKTPAPDGMIMDKKGNLYMGDLENNSIIYITPDRKTIKTLASEGDISWPDTFTIYDGYLYYTNSRISEVKNNDISNMIFTVNRIKLPE